MRRRKNEPKPEPKNRAPEKLAARPFAGPLADLKKQLDQKPAAPSTASGASVAKTPASASSAASRAPKRPEAPLAHLPYEDRAAFHQAFAGVRPLENPKAKYTPDAPRKQSEDELRARAEYARELEAADEAVRARLDQLVAGPVTFKLQRSTATGEIECLRDGEREAILRTISGPKVVVQDTLDLHGLSADDAERELSAFVRSRQLRGDRVVRIIHGKGLHSEGGYGVLEDRVVRALTEGGSAPKVRAFMTAPDRLGGRGALLVRLTER